MADLAERSGTTTSYLKKVEAGTVHPPGGWAKQVSRQLALIVGEIADGAYTGPLIIKVPPDLRLVRQVAEVS